MKKIITTLLLIIIVCGVYSQNGNLGVKKLTASDSVKGKTLTVTGKYTLPNTDSLTNYLVRTNGSGKWNYVSPSGVGQDSIYVSYCCGCSMITGYKNIGDTLVVDTCYVNKIILDSLFNHLVLINKLDTGKVSTSGDNMYGDLIINNADLYADTTHSALKQATYINKLASWDSQGVLNDSIVPYNISDTLYNKIVAIRPNNHDTSFSDIDLIANTTLFKGRTSFEVYPGNYTTSVNLVRDSCSLYFHSGATITKTTVGAIFDYSAITSGCDILGHGTFIATTNCQNIAYCVSPNLIDYKLIFEADSVVSTNKGLFLNSTNMLKIKIGTCIISGGNALQLYGGNLNADVNISKLVVTGGIALELGKLVTGTTNCTFNGTYVNSTTYGFYNNAGNVLNINCPYINGTTAAVYNYASGAGIATINIHGSVYGKTNVTGGYVYGGQHYYIDISGGSINASSLYLSSLLFRLTQTGGTSNIYINAVTWYPRINISAGVSNIFIDNYTQGVVEAQNQFTVSSTGKLYLKGYWYGQARYGTALETSYYPIVQTGGYIDATNLIMEMPHKTFYQAFVNKTGGVFKCNNSTFIVKGGYAEAFYCSSTSQDLHIYSGGVTTNTAIGTFLSAKSRKDSLKVGAVAITTIILNDGSGGAETFTETDVATYNTTALMAQRMASLINASGTLDITATYVSGATFNIEADVAGVNYTQSGLVNLTNYTLRPNRELIDDLVGGTIIEDSDISF
jgi:hypothetical protein